MLTIEKIPYSQFGSSFQYKLDTDLFNYNIFKMCTECGEFIHDFSDIFCDKCGFKLHYVDVSDIDTLKKWLISMNLDDIPKCDKSGAQVHDELFDDELFDDELFDDELFDNKLLDETHNCFNGTDCIDCYEKKWDVSDEKKWNVSDEKNDNDAYWKAYFDATYLEDGVENESELSDDGEFWDHDHDYDQDSVS
jgi:hypothetical protein